MPIIGSEKHCPSCQQANPAIRRSCLHCGAELSGASASPKDDPPDVREPDAPKRMKLVHPGAANNAATPVAQPPPAQSSGAKVKLRHPGPAATPHRGPPPVPGTAPMSPDLMYLAAHGSKNQSVDPQPVGAQGPLTPVPPLPPAYVPARPRSGNLWLQMIGIMGVVLATGAAIFAAVSRNSKTEETGPLIPLPPPQTSISAEGAPSELPPTIPATAPPTNSSTSPIQPTIPATLDETFRQKIKNATVAIHSRQALGGGLGSGFFIDEEGRIVTNEHVIHAELPGRRLSVQLYGSEEVFDDVVCISRDPRRDLALLQVRGVRPKAILALHRGSRVPETTPVVVVGHPRQEFWSITQGTITGIREHEGNSFYGTDARIEPGNSGGPVVLRSTGEVVGVSDWKIVATAMNYAIPVDAVIDLVQGATGRQGKPCQ